MESQASNHIQKIISQNSFSPNDILEILNFVYEHIDLMTLKDKGEYTVLWLFADWPHKTSLGDSFPALMVVKRLNEALGEMRSVADNKFFIDQLMDIVSFHKLKDQMENFLQLNNLPTDLTAFPYRWKVFIAELINLIKDKPLAFPDPRNKYIRKIYGEEIFDQARQREGVISLTITEFDTSLFAGFTSLMGKKVTCMVILTSDATKIVMPMV